MAHNDVTDLRKIGVDPGFGNVKVAEVQNDSMATFMISSLVGIGRRRKEGLNLSGVVKARRGRSLYRVEFGGTEWLAGPGVPEVTDPVSHQMDIYRFIDSAEMLVSLYVCLYHLVNGGSHELAIAMGLPVEALQDQSEIERIEKPIRNRLVGQHSFRVDGVETVLHIVNVRCKIAQPVATWFEWGLDYSGQWARGDESLRAPALIIDEGFNTLDVLVVEGGKVSERHSGGDTLGMRRAAERLKETASNKYGIELEAYAANELIQNVVNGLSCQVYIRGQAVDVITEARQALRSLESDVVEFVDQAVGKLSKSARVLLTGGGAIALGGRLMRKYPHAEVMSEPILANARGLAKMAQRRGFLDG